MSRRTSAPTVFLELDTLRALAISLVLATHAEGWITEREATRARRSQ